jgi:hypothetical protein
MTRSPSAGMDRWPTGNRAFLNESAFAVGETLAPCHCEARSAEAIPCLPSALRLVRQGFASALRASQ